MALYTKKGDDGSTGVIDVKRRISKSSVLPECLGTMDELNSFLGLCKVKAEESAFTVGEEQAYVCCIIHEVQQNLFIIQSEIAGSPKTIAQWKVQRLEMLVNEIEKELAPIESFTIAGGSELTTFLDIARTIARRAERYVVLVHESKIQALDEHTRAYMNRLSSLLFGLARLTNKKFGITEEHPDYK